MTTLMYIRDMKIATNTEIMKFSKEDPDGMATLRKWAEEEMINKGIEVTKSKAA